MKSRILALLFALRALAPVFAHSVWIEPGPAGELIIRFAEPDGKYEKSPGHLDQLSLPEAWSFSAAGPSPLAVSKQPDHFLIAGSSTTNSVQIQTRFDVMGAPGKPGRLPWFYARWSPDLRHAGSPALTLDLVPAGTPGVVRAFFRGQPLGGVQATLRAPDESEKTLTADASGYLRFTPGQKGQYLLTVAHHREALPGFAGGRPYELTSHNAALTWKE